MCAVLQREAKQGELDAVTKLLQEKQFIRKGIVQAAEKWASAVGDTPRLASPFTITHHKNHTHASYCSLRFSPTHVSVVFAGLCRLLVLAAHRGGV